MANISYINKYAKALFEASVKNNSTADVRQGLTVIFKAVKSIPEFKHILSTKNTSREKKKNVLYNVLSGKANPLVIELLLILIDSDQIQLFGDIINKYNQLMNSNSNDLDVSITSNVEFSSEKLGSIKSNLVEKLNKQINIKTNTNTNLLGVVQLRIGNTIIDNSLSNKLSKLKNNLKKNQMSME